MSWVETGVIVFVILFVGKIFFAGKGDKDVDFLTLTQAGALVIDVRTAGEFSGGHIQGSINIPYDVIVREIGKYEPSKDRPIVVYCRSGARSSLAKRSLQTAGYTQIKNGGSFRRMKKILLE